MNRSLYLDHAATTPLRPEAAEAMAPFHSGEFGNPSGVHAVSRRAKAAVEDARERIAGLIGAEHPLDIVFTGGGTESDNLGVAGPAMFAPGGVSVSAVEHQAVLETARFLERLGRPVSVIAVDSRGRVDVEEAATSVRGHPTVLSVMAANNETGVRQPVAEIATLCREESPQTLIHTDAVQAFVSEEVSMPALGADLMTLSAHKFGGPQGVGLLCVPQRISLEALLHGGGQEIGRRSGTHNVAGIVGMAAAMEAAVKDRDRFRADVGAARDSFELALVQKLPDVVFTAPAVDRLVQHSHFRIPGVDAETLLIRLDGLGVAAAAGSACHSGALDVSPVLTAMGLSDAEARSSVRFSFGWTSRPNDGREAAAAVVECVEALR